MNDTIEITEEKQDKGFTLVELLIVIVILGILATVTVFAVSGITQTAETNACDIDEATVQTGIDAYTIQEGGAPADLDALVNLNYLRSAPAGFTVDDGVITLTPDECT